jgi:stage III sporulation protein AE
MEEKLSLLLELIEKAVGVSLKVTIGIVTGFSLLQSMVTPALDSLQTSALKKAVSAIPGIGGFTEGMFEMVMGSAILIKGSIGIYITLVLLGLCCIPILKILLLSCVTKLGAAMIGIVSDKRLTNCADRMGNGNLMLLRMTVSSIGMFIIQIAIITYTTNRGI